MQARRDQFEPCMLCQRPVKKGQWISKWLPGRWVHAECAHAAAETERVLSGETFAGTAQPYRRRVKRRD